jgi:lipoprotein-anchoring transpeptidase ErfK/SrfK
LSTQAAINDALERLKAYGLKKGDSAIVVLPGEQRLYLVRADGRILADYPVSTAAKGLGCEDGSNRTPTGVHRVAERIGDGEPIGRVFRARVPTDEIAEISEDPAYRSPEDLITTRILWLEGLEEGINRGPGVDSHDRYIYIHGTPEEERLGAPASHGCVRMRNADVIELFDLLSEAAIVYIDNSSPRS